MLGACRDSLSFSCPRACLNQWATPAGGACNKQAPGSQLAACKAAVRGVGIEPTSLAFGRQIKIHDELARLCRTDPRRAGSYRFHFAIPPKTNSTRTAPIAFFSTCVAFARSLATLTASRRVLTRFSIADLSSAGIRLVYLMVVQ